MSELAVFGLSLSRAWMPRNTVSPTGVNCEQGETENGNGELIKWLLNGFENRTSCSSYSKGQNILLEQMWREDFQLKANSSCCSIIFLFGGRIIKKKADGRPACFKTKIEKQTTILLACIMPKMDSARTRTCKCANAAQTTVNHFETKQPVSSFLEWNSMRKKQSDSRLNPFNFFFDLQFKNTHNSMTKLSNQKCSMNCLKADRRTNERSWSHEPDKTSFWAPFIDLYRGSFVIKSFCMWAWMGTRTAFREIVHSFIHSTRNEYDLFKVLVFVCLVPQAEQNIWLWTWRKRSFQFPFHSVTFNGQQEFV